VRDAAQGGQPRRLSEVFPMPTVTKVRKELSTDGTHRHIRGVCTSADVYYSRGEVVASMEAGQRWVTSGGGSEATIRMISYCPAAACLATPYITTRADSSRDDNLENLPEC
jgi:Protein of unknown function (DUF3892)